MGDTPQFDVSFSADLDDATIISIKCTDSNGGELTASGSNISVAGGKYSYALTLSSEKGFEFSNELDGVYYEVTIIH